MTRHLPLVLVIALLITFRILGAVFPETLPNFQPLAAVFFCGAMLAPGWRGAAIPLAIWALTFPLGLGHNALDPAIFLTTLLAFATIFVLGKFLSTRGFAALLLGSLIGSLLFHLITNGAAWIGDPRYAKTLGGLFQSLWLGAPGDVLPSWVFLRNLTAANMIFTTIFLSARLSLPQWPAKCCKEGLAESH